jgi:hypothetical protein
MTRCLYVVDPASVLYTLDSVTGSSRVVGSVGIANVTDIAFHGPTLYGVGFSQFLRIDPDTGTGTTIGSIGFSTNGLAVASDGTIFAGTTTGQLVSINSATGAGAVVGSFGGGLISSGDLAFDSNDELFGALEQAGTVVLASIDRNSGAATPIGPTGVARVYGLAFHCCRLYGSTDGGELVDINAASGSATIIGKNALIQWGMAARPCCHC